jgi:hypothetical protein
MLARRRRIASAPTLRSNPTMKNTPRPEASGAGEVFWVQIPASQTSPPSQSVVSSQGPPSMAGVFVGVSAGVLVGVIVAVLVDVPVAVAVGVMVGLLVGVPVGVTVGVTHSHCGRLPWAISEPTAFEETISIQTCPLPQNPPHSGAFELPHDTGQFKAVQDVLSPM